MSEGEETDEPSTGGDRSVPAEPRPSPHFAVVITGDGSAAIDGVPVEAGEGEPVDAAILDTLHRSARDRNAPVTAAISDPSAGYVAYVEVTPDGSSRLLEQQEEERQEEQPLPPADDDDADLDRNEDLDGDDDGGGNDFDHEHEEDETNALPPSAEAGPAPTPAPAPAPAPKIVRRNESRQSDDEYKGPGLLSRPFFVGPVALVVAALVIVPLVMLGSGGEDEKQSARSSSATSSIPSRKPEPTHSVSPVTLPPLPSVSPSPTPKPKPEPKHKADAKEPGGGVVTVTARPPQATATVTAKPQQDTAATAVNRLAKNDPSGRHICYRAYVSGQGWQKPVCDGTMAGTSGRNRALKAINIAVRGVGGSAANAFVHYPESTDGNGQWKTPWSPVTEGKDFYIGSSKQGAPNMLGYAINVGNGTICQAALLHNGSFGEPGCTDPRPNYTFGGTLRNDVYLEAVKFTV
ncbi:hypothetical protein [Streptomyces sp. NPDC088725]|uniref:hypothetical protein n=1 Tax=Streptomyces sp. NPDC088725 TaxID=3365873 RepID=UPI00380963F8